MQAVSPNLTDFTVSIQFPPISSICPTAGTTVPLCLVSGAQLRSVCTSPDSWQQQRAAEPAFTNLTQASEWTSPCAPLHHISRLIECCGATITSISVLERLDAIKHLLLLSLLLLPATCFCPFICHFPLFNSVAYGTYVPGSIRRALCTHFQHMPSKFYHP